MLLNINQKAIKIKIRIKNTIEKLLKLFYLLY